MKVFKILLLLIISICIFFNVTIDFAIFDSFLRFNFSQQPRHHFSYQWLDNVKINKYAKFDLNISSGSRVTCAFSRTDRQDRLQ